MTEVLILAAIAFVLYVVMTAPARAQKRQWEREFRDRVQSNFAVVADRSRRGEIPLHEIDRVTATLYRGFMQHKQPEKAYQVIFEYGDALLARSTGLGAKAEAEGTDAAWAAIHEEMFAIAERWNVWNEWFQQHHRWNEQKQQWEVKNLIDAAAYWPTDAAAAERRLEAQSMYDWATRNRKRYQELLDERTETQDPTRSYWLTAQMRAIDAEFEHYNTWFAQHHHWNQQTQTWDLKK